MLPLYVSEIRDAQGRTITELARFPALAVDGPDDLPDSDEFAL